MKKSNTTKKKIVRVRFAPSPTGYLHIGSARTALINYLFAKSREGSFVLRIEDTDRNRFIKDSVNDIVKSLKWLGIKWNEGPGVGGPFSSYYQSKRLDLYKKYAEKLVEQKRAYYCFCSPARLDVLRKTQTAQGIAAPKYDKRCRNLSLKDIINLKNSHKYVIRFKSPENEKIQFKDLLKGNVEFKKQVDDFIILKSDRYPTYHLASVVDDHLMKISHVIRGDEWLSSAPKHFLLYEAFGWKPPKFIHLPPILSPTGGKLSKREGSVSVKDFREKGYLPEAIINFIVLLGWNPDNNRELFSLKDLVKEFSLKGLGGAPSIFDIDKLNYFNGYYIRNKTDQDLLKSLKEFDSKIAKLASVDYLLKIISIIKNRMVFLSDFLELSRYLLKAPQYNSHILIFKKSTKEKTLIGLQESLAILQDIPESKWSEKNFTELLNCIVESKNLSNGDIFWAVRAALSGQEASPSPSELLFVLGKKESLKRIKKAINLLG